MCCGFVGCSSSLLRIVAVICSSVKYTVSIQGLAMSRKLSKLFWCGVFVGIFGSYLLLNNLVSIISFASLYTSYFAHSSLTNDMTGVYYILVTSGVMLVFEVLLVVVGVYVAKIFIEVKQRPYTIIREKYSSGVPTKASGPDVSSESNAPDKILTSRCQNSPQGRP